MERAAIQRRPCDWHNWTYRHVTPARGADYRRLGLVATRCSRCGTVKVYLGSTLLKSVSLAATSTKRRQIIPIDVSATTRSGTITIRQSSGGKPVIIEGLVVALE